MELCLDQLVNFAETCRAEQVAQWIADQGFDQICDPGCRGAEPVTLETAIIDLLAEGVKRGRMAGIDIFEIRVRRIWEHMLEQYAESHEDELYEIALDRRDELLCGDGRRPADQPAEIRHGIPS